MQLVSSWKKSTFEVNFTLAKWVTHEYNFGNNFDGTNFVAPLEGVYSFYVTSRTEASSTSGVINLHVNDKLTAASSKSITRGKGWNFVISIDCWIWIKSFDLQKILLKAVPQGVAMAIVAAIVMVFPIGLKVIHSVEVLYYKQLSSWKKMTKFTYASKALIHSKMLNLHIGSRSK